MSLQSTTTHCKKDHQTISQRLIKASIHESTAAENDREKIQIFLGGSCNPTTWRQTIAIPYLELKGISYYNPQIDNWTPEVVDVERHAKRNADWLLFVIDKQTRSTVSLVESAFMAGAGKRLVLVIYPFDYSIDHLSIQSDTKQTSNVIETHKEITTTKNTTAHAANPIQLQSTSSLKSSTSSRCITTSSSNFASGTIRVNGESISLGEFHELRQARYILQSLVLSQEIPIFSDIPQALRYVSDSLTTHRAQSKVEHSEILSSSLPSSSNLNSATGEITGSQISSNDNNDFPKSTNAIHNNALKDVFLSLDDNDCDPSLESMIIPIIQEKGLSYEYKPMSHITRFSGFHKTPITNSNEVAKAISELSANNRYSSEESDQKLIQNSKIALEKELSAIRSSRVILFVITNKCRGLSIMVLASHFMALFRQNVVLCIQYLEEPCCIDGEVLSRSAIADYNRGRVYLGDYAVETHVPVFGTIREAVDCCSQKCSYDNKDK